MDSARAIRPLQHPYERSRLFLAWLGVVFGAVVYLGLFAITIPLTIVVWLLLQVHRAHLLGGGVRVTEDTLPGLQLALAEVREQLGYHRPIDIYVVEEPGPPAYMISYLGTRIIVFKGALVADLQSADNRPQLVFLIGQFLGALKSRYQRFGPFIVVLNSVQSLKLFNLLINPYTRAATYSGDQIGMACCGDMQAAFAAMERLLVGKELAPSLVRSGLLEQLVEARRRRMLKLAQLLRRYPHLTNRYLNLLRFAAESQPAEFLVYRATFNQETDNRLSVALAAAPGYRSRPVAEPERAAQLGGEPASQNHGATP